MLSSKSNVITNNIFDSIPENFKKEIIENIYVKQNLVIERIISNGQATPTGQWYDQNKDEWLILMQGDATILLEDNHQLINLTAGDYLLIPAHTRHRVEWTRPNFNTIWLAMHMGESEE